MSKEKEVSNLLEELEELLTRATEIKGQIQDLMQGKRPRTNLYLHVRMPDGTIICHPRRSDTFVEAIELLGTERAYHAAVAQDIRRRGYPVVDVGHYDEPSWRESGEYGIYVGGNTPDKAKDLKKIADSLKLPIKVKVLDEADYEVFKSRHS